MCEANVYINTVEGKEELIMEGVNILRPEENGIHLQSIFGEQKVVKARIKEMQMVDHRIILEAD
ncbi:MAG: CooT family nickel-binding protein [Thermodesulfobacteriota bacterium]|nr:CooT family nickel-binding protein [Thermodesulfobacteriota bacterium]